MLSNIKECKTNNYKGATQILFFSFVAIVIKAIFNKTKRIFAQSEGLGYLQFYNLLKAASIVFISIIFAKFIKSALLINNWETLMLLGTSFTFFYVSGLGYTLISFIKQYQQKEWPVIFKNTFILLFFFGIISSLAIIITGIFFKSIAFPLNELLLFSIYIIGTVCCTVVEYVFFLECKFKKLIGWGIINFILFITAPTLPLLCGYSFIYSLYAMALLGIVKFIFTISLIKNPFEFNALTYINPILKFNWPIITSLIFGTGYIYIATFIIKASVSVNDFNIFRFGSREFPLFIVMANSFSIVLGGIAANKFSKADFWAEIKKSHLRLMHQLFPLACLLMLSSEFIFKNLFSVNFVQSYQVFNILLLTLIVRLLFPQSLLMGRGKTKFAFYSAVIEFVIGIFLVGMFSSKFGIVGAALGLTLAYIIEKIILISFCYQQKIAFHKSINLVWFFGYTLLLLGCFVIKY